jgi:hypothetical protein
MTPCQNIGLLSGYPRGYALTNPASDLKGVMTGYLAIYPGKLYEKEIKFLVIPGLFCSYRVFVCVSKSQPFGCSGNSSQLPRNPQTVKSMVTQVYSTSSPMSLRLKSLNINSPRKATNSQSRTSFHPIRLHPGPHSGHWRLTYHEAPLFATKAGKSGSTTAGGVPATTVYALGASKVMSFESLQASRVRSWRQHGALGTTYFS